MRPVYFSEKKVIIKCEKSHKIVISFTNNVILTTGVCIKISKQGLLTGNDFHFFFKYSDGFDDKKDANMTFLVIPVGICTHQNIVTILDDPRTILAGD
jgi:hypothetical protein